MEIVSAIAGKIAEYLSVAAGGQLGYLFHYNDNIKDLQERVKELSGCKERVQVKIATAKRNGESIFIDVQDWIEKVDKISAEAEKFFEDEAKANKRCLKGGCINLGQRYRFSKEAKEQTLAISYLVLQEVERFEHVSSLASPSAVVSSSSVFPSGTFESRNSLKKKILKTLIDDDNINIIGICGMGGVGKTTLVKEISRQVKEEKIYEEVVMAVVSQNPSIMKIQVRASFLRDRIKEKKQILVILDDVWKRIEFDEIGIPWSDHRGCKILITSRSIAVCNQMRCQKNYTVETLSKQESWDLFSKIVGLTIENSDINQIAGEVIAKCGGLPIAIVTIARALKDKNKRAWSNAAQQLKTSILTSLKWFGDADKTIEGVRNRVHAIVSDVTYSFLLIDDGKNCVKMHNIVRDFALTVASKYDHKFIVKAGTRLREWPNGDTFDEFTCGDLDVQGYFDMSRYSRTMILQQINNSVTYEWVKGLLKRIEFLSVETIDNLESVSHNLVEEGFNELKSLDINSCEKIKCLLNTLELTPNSTFHNLEELHLYEIPNLVEMCKGEPPAEAFSKLKVLEVARCDKMLNVVPSQLLRKFQNLHTFIARNCESMVYTFDCEEIKITKGESKLLSSLEYLELYYLPEMSHIWNGDHQSISLQNLKKVEIGFCGKLTNLFSATLLQGLICLEDIFVQNCDELKEIFEKKEALGEELDPAKTSPGLQNLTSIDIWDCEQLRSLFSPSIVKCLVKLKRLVVRRCSSIQEIIKKEKGEKKASIKRLLFPSLSNLELRYLENLTCFSSGPYAIEFPTLERLKIYRCENMKTFGYGEQVTPKLKEVILDGEKRRNDNINTTLQEFLNENRKKKKRDGVIEIEM
ncbi:disease resistance protein UNI-like [Mangifera indica]|uniref:disease resistance protein UNI-like n=1 Tax=Mangifera indica TaxID=29780 RepID=UPI001CFB7415|nr:disease resistance protein UNI-like [Mangifera indica]